MSLSQLYSGVILNSNGPATATASITTMVYQVFQLPDDYVRGDDVGLVAPLTGFQLFLNVAAGGAADATVTWTLDRLDDETWLSLASGATTGAAIDGSAWFTVYLTEPLVIESTWLTSSFRIGVQGSEAIESIMVA